jgi:hypothetical protein
MKKIKENISFFSKESKENMLKLGVYCIEFINRKNRYYVGHTLMQQKETDNTFGFWKRWRLHLYYLRKNKHHSIHLQNAYNKYGENNIEFKILEYCNDVNEIVKKEQYWIDKLDSYNNGYNILPFAGSSKGRIMLLNRGGKKICQYSLEGVLLATYASAREITRQLNINYKSIHKCVKGEILTSNGYIWRFEEDNFDKFNTNPKISPTKKKILQYDKNMNFIKEYASITEAHKQTKITLSNISMCLHNQRNYAGGYIWKIK